MPADVIQVQYEQLSQVASQFGRTAEGVAATQQSMLRSAQQLRQGGWEGKGSSAFFAEMDRTAFPTIHRLSCALIDAQQVTLQIRQVLQAAEEEAAQPFKAFDPVPTQPYSELIGSGAPTVVLASSAIPAPVGPPNIPVPGAPGNEWKWNPNPQNRRGGTWGPKRPLSGQGQPSASWDPEGHWDVDDGKGNRQRYDPDGKPISPEEAHGDKPRPEPSSFDISQDLMDRIAAFTGLTGAALVIYLIISEGSRLFPPRNLVPIP